MAYLNVNEGRIESKAYKGRKLTPKMRSFIDEYFGAASFNAVKAIELSLYQCKTEASTMQTAAELMRHPLVRAEIERRQALRTERSEVKAEWLINKLMTIVENTETENPQAALRGIELLGKTIAIWRDKQEITGADGGAIQHEQKVKEDVADFTSRIAGLAKRNGTANVVEFPGRTDTSGA